MILFTFILLLNLNKLSETKQLTAPAEKNISAFAMGFSEILNSIGDNSIAVLLPSNQNLQRKINEILKESFTSLTLQTVLFTDQEKFFMYVETSLKGSIQTTNIIFDTPEFIISEIKLRNLAHRLSLFLFYWGAVSIDEINSMEIEFKEPLRVAIITRPRKKVYRIYYNQAVPDGSGKMKLVNWYDFNSLGLYKEPLLPRLETVFKKLEWRTLYFPAINTPPWLFVNYKKKENLINGSFDTNLTSSEFEQSLDYQDDYKENNNDTNLEVTGGRDDALLKLIAQKMQFNIQYVDPPERTQGSIIGNSDINFTFSGGIGMIQRREADMFLGDIPLSWERRQAVEFTFFTLADSGAFATHAPRKLSEALVLIRPFLWEVWPILAITVVISAPALYFVIICPYFFEDNYDYFRWKHLSYKNESWVDSRTTTAEKFDHDTHFYYINEITGDKKCSLKKTQLIQYNGIPTGFLSKVTWFIVNLYLKQSVEFKHKTNRARFLAMTIWLGATYVLGDMYSAQLTSQLARPAKESPLNTLHKLEYAMQFKEYQLYVEKGSAAQTIIENGTGTFARLYTLMRKQPTYVVDSVEDGIISIITYGSRAVLGGRGTLYYNTKLFGSTNFHISEKLYTRYSAIAVQNGCLFLDSLNIILMNLFEAGILDKMTNSEYEKMFGTQEIKLEDNGKNDEKNEDLTKQESQNVNEITKIKTKNQDTNKLQSITLRMLKGAFFVLLSGHTLAFFILILEKLEHKHRCIYKILRNCKRNIKSVRKLWYRSKNNLHDVLHKYI